MCVPFLGKEKAQMIYYGDIIRIISKNKDAVDFGNFGIGLSDSTIRNTEEKLHFSLPDSYKWWLKNYSQGIVQGYEIYRPTGENSAQNIDLFNVYESFTTDFEIEKGVILPLLTTDDEFFCFLVGDEVKNNEYCVYEAYSNSIYANNFLDFLKRIITEG
jgi:hypothetical protein